MRPSYHHICLTRNLGSRPLISNLELCNNINNGIGIRSQLWFRGQGHGGGRERVVNVTLNVSIPT